MVGPDIVLPPGVKITLKKKSEDDSDFGMDELSVEEKPKAEQRDGTMFSLFCCFSVLVIGEDGAVFN